MPALLCPFAGVHAWKHVGSGAEKPRLGTGFELTDFSTASGKLLLLNGSQCGFNIGGFKACMRLIAILGFGIVPVSALWETI